MPGANCHLMPIDCRVQHGGRRLPSGSVGGQSCQLQKSRCLVSTANKRFLSDSLPLTNGIVGQTGVMDAKSLPRVETPNRKGLFPDPRPYLHNPPCRVDCR